MADEASVERRLAAILAADVVGYSRLMGVDEVGTLTALKAIRRELADPAIAAHHGRVVKTTGDGMLIEFASVVDAVACALPFSAAWWLGMRASRRTSASSSASASTSVTSSSMRRIFMGMASISRRASKAWPSRATSASRARRMIRSATSLMWPSRIWASRASRTSPGRSASAASPGNAGERAPYQAPAKRAHFLPDKPSIAVLPFQNMSGDPEQEYFADGMAEDIITALSKLRWFFVIARNSTFAYKGKSPDVRQVARELGVRYVLEGSVRRAGSRLRITAQLIDAITGNHIWAERYDREMADIFAVQDEITQSVVAAIEPQLHAAENLRIQGRPPESLDAWGCVIRALWHVGRFNRDRRKGNTPFEASNCYKPRICQGTQPSCLRGVARGSFGRLQHRSSACLGAARTHNLPSRWMMMTLGAIYHPGGSRASRANTTMRSHGIIERSRSTQTSRSRTAFRLGRLPGVANRTRHSRRLIAPYA